MQEKVLLLVNHASRSTSPGYEDALRVLVAEGGLAGYQSLYVPNEPDCEDRTLRAIERSREDLILAISLKDHICDSDRLERALAGRPVIYWEGDTWGRRKPIPEAMKYWLSRADWVFSVALGEQQRLFRAAGARRVHHCCSTYDHVIFPRPCPIGQPVAEVAFVGSNLMRFPPLGGLPGSRTRMALAALLRLHYGDGFRLGGRGWPGVAHASTVAFQDQLMFVSNARVVITWNHFPGYFGAFSDRLPITLMSGRPQVTDWKPGIEWLQEVPAAVNLARTPSGALRQIDRLLAMSDADRRSIGEAAQSWTHGRLSHLQAVRHMLGFAIPRIEPPPSTPWSQWR